MKCEDVLELISAALDGELTAEERTALDEHLASCPACAALYQELSGQSRLLRELDCHMPEDLSQGILTQLPDPSAPPKRPRRVIHWQKWAALAACVALVVWVGLTSPFQIGSDDSSSAAAPGNAASGDTADTSGTSSGGTDGLEQTTGDSPNDSASDTAPAPAALDPEAGLELDGSTKTASLDALYLSVTWTEHTASGAQLIASTDDLAALLEQYPADDLFDATNQYDEPFFVRSCLIAVSLAPSSSSISYTVEDVRAGDDGWEIVIQRTAPEAAADDMAAWLILIETDQAIDSTDALTIALTD